jgi:hypothetical protein
MTPSGIRGVGQKSNRTRALELWRLKYTPEEIARALEVDLDQVWEWISPKSKSVKPRQNGVSPASDAQRKKVEHRACIVCRKSGPCDPAHLIDRSLAPVEMADDARAVVPLCPGPNGCHRQYDEEMLDLIPYLEPNFREEVAFAVEQVGIMRALRRLSGDRWVPVTTGGPE